MKFGHLILLVLIGLGWWWEVSAHVPTAEESVFWEHLWHEVTDYFEDWSLQVSSSSVDALSEDIWHDEALLREHVASFGLIATVEQLDRLAATRGNCHQVAHQAGRFAFELFG